jgi:hypothetical protein
VNYTIRIEQRRVFATEFLINTATDDSRNVFVEECGFKLLLRRHYGRSVRGTWVSVTVPTIRGQNITLLSAINSHGVVHYKVFGGGCSGRVFGEFLSDLDAILVEIMCIKDRISI